MSSQTILAQVLSFLPKREFRRFVKKYKGDRNTRTFSCWDQFICMMVAQLGKKESLRELETCARGFCGALYHSGVKGKVSRTTLAYANENRSSAIFGDFCKLLIARTKKLYINDDTVGNLEGLVYVLDSTIIELSMSLCPWSYFGGSPRAGIKIHTQLDLRGKIPSFIHISKAKMSDNYFLDHIIVEPGAFYVMDRGYVDFPRLYNMHKKHGYFVVRSKWHLSFKRIYSNQKDENNTAIISDQVVRCSGGKGRYSYPERIRKIKYKDPETNKVFTFLTNNFEIPAQVIADLYKARWQIELFFKWIKQNLLITTFLGRSQNAIETQIWIAVASYLAVAIAKKTLRTPATVTEIISLLPQILFLKTPFNKPFSDHDYRIYSKRIFSADNQLNLL
jgi:Transposase DDE domain/Domain of unknown function (DUF4372)